MNKIFSILIFSLMFSLIGCNNSDSYRGEIVDINYENNEESSKVEKSIDTVTIKLEDTLPGASKSTERLILKIPEKNLDINVKKLQVGKKIDFWIVSGIVETKPPEALAEKIKLVEND